MRLWTPCFYLSLLIRVSHGQLDETHLSNRYTNFSLGDFAGKLTQTSHNLVSLQPLRDPNFDFLPFDYLPNRTYDGAHHIGDVTLRYRRLHASSWTSVDSAFDRDNVTPIPSLHAEGVIAAADMTLTLNDTAPPIRVTREWLYMGTMLGLRINITNVADSTVEIGSLGLPIAINNIFIGRSDVEVQRKCSFADPYIGLDAGYVQVTPVSGVGSALVILPLDRSPFEAWRFLSEPAGDLGYHVQTYEGNYEWQIHSQAWAEEEWSNARPWNTPTQKSLNVGEIYSVGLRFALADSIQTIEDTVVAAQIPVAQGVPGYVVPRDMSASILFKHSSPVKSIDSNDAFTMNRVSDNRYELNPTNSAWGRAAVSILYEDGKAQIVHYFITKPAPQAVSDLGSFFTSKAHFQNASDPFHRAPSIMTYDREEDAIVVQDERVWIAGISDEGGTGAYVAAAMKQYIQPAVDEVKILDDFIHQTIWGTLQQNGSYSVVSSAFFYDPNVTDYAYNPSFNWTTWASWNRTRAYGGQRAYNYIWPTTAYWTTYRVARDYPEINLQADWSWYLMQAYNTIQYCFSDTEQCQYSTVGLMGETVLYELLVDLLRENMTAEHNALEDNLRQRADLWAQQAVPFGSEMAWDSTGQEGVYLWSRYFGIEDKRRQSIETIIGYMPTVAHWGWNGNARRYWDFLYAGKTKRIERQIHHYGSGLNALPALSEYESQSNLSDQHLLRIGYGGTFGPLTNIDEGGFASAGFHSWPNTLKWDALSGDYGQNFLGLALGHTTYLVEQQDGDLIAYGGNIKYLRCSMVEVEPRDAVRRRIFVGPLRLKVEISAGAISSFTYDSSNQSVTLQLLAKVPVDISRDSVAAQGTVIWLSEPAADSGTTSYRVVHAEARARDGTLITLAQSATTTVTIMTF